MDIIFYNNEDFPNKINKTLSDGDTKTGTLRNSTSVLEPEFLIKSDTVFTYNYCYIADFNRYYFIRNITIENNGLYKISCRVDVLMSFKNDVLSSEADIIESENPNEMFFSTDVSEFTDIIEYPLNNVFNVLGETVLITAKEQL